MVAILVRLKLTLLRNGLRRSVWRTVGLILGLLYALAIVVFVDIGLVALRTLGSVELTRTITVIAFAVLTVGWLLLSLLVFGVDETVDPSRFALLPVRARDLRPGLLIAGLLGSPGIATVLVAAGFVAAWSRSPLTILVAVLSAVVGVATCFLLSRAGTAAFAAFLGSRRFRDFAFVVLALLGVVLGVGGNLLGRFLAEGPERIAAAFSGIATVLGWLPFGWIWALPGDVATGSWLTAGLRLVLGVGLLAGLWAVWGHFLDRRLTEPVEGAAATKQVRRGGLSDWLYPPTPAGAVAARTLRYWRRDPRYLAGVAGFAIGPIILIVLQVTSPDGGLGVVAAFSPALLAWLIGISLAQDLSYDGTALWQHAASGLRGADDRAGRVMSIATIFAPMTLVLLVVAGAVTGEWSLMVVVTALTVGFGLIGLGVGCYVGVLWQWPAPPPGANPFQKGQSGGLPALASFSVTSLASVVLILPTAAVAVGSYWIGWLAWVALLVGLVSGIVVLLLGIRLGGARLDRRWPEILLQISER